MRIAPGNGGHGGGRPNRSRPRPARPGRGRAPRGARALRPGGDRPGGAAGRRRGRCAGHGIGPGLRADAAPRPGWSRARRSPRSRCGGPASPRRPAPTFTRCGRGPRPRARQDAAAGGQGRLAGRRQGRGRARLARGGGGGHPRPVRTAPAAERARACSRSGWTGARCRPSPWSAARPSCRWRRPATTSGWATATRSEHRRDGRLRPVPWFGAGSARSGGGRGLRADRLADGARRHAVPRRALRRADADRRMDRWCWSSTRASATRRRRSSCRCSTATWPAPCWAWRRGDRGLMEGSVALRSGAAVGVVLASEGYPDAPQVGRPLTGAEPAGPDDDGPLLCFHARHAPRRRRYVDDRRPGRHLRRPGRRPGGGARDRLRRRRGGVAGGRPAARMTSPRGRSVAG